MGGVFERFETAQLDPQPDQDKPPSIGGSITGILGTTKNFLVQGIQIFVILAGLPVFILGLSMPIYAKIPFLAISVLTYLVIISNVNEIIDAIGSIIPTT